MPMKHAALLLIETSRPWRISVAKPARDRFRSDRDEQRHQFRAEIPGAQAPDAVAIDLGECRSTEWNCCGFLRTKTSGPRCYIISGFDRRVLESAFRLGEAQASTWPDRSRSPCGWKS
jgi:hypothetical protein